MEFIIPDFASPGIWVSLITLCFLEIVLGIDNLIFISIIAGKLPGRQQRKARNIGLLLAMLFRIGLLFAIQIIANLKEAIITIPAIDGISNDAMGLSYKDLILIAGGLFLIVKSTLEIHHKLQRPNTDSRKAKPSSLSINMVLLQIVLVDAVFSLDSILTAIGLVDSIVIMVIAVVVSMCTMMLFAGPVTRVVNKHPTLQMLALAFLVIIGVVLVSSGLHKEVSKGIIYSCLAFSLAVEFLNIRLRNSSLKQAK